MTCEAVASALRNVTIGMAAEKIVTVISDITVRHFVTH
jgi:hypothetical protein